MIYHYDHTTPEVRKLWKRDAPEILMHLLRLDHQSSRSRFGVFVKDGFIRNYAERIIGVDSLVFGAFFDGQLRGIGELRGLSQSSPYDAELALSVEREWQNQGVGRTLFSRLVTAAQNRGIKSLHVLYLNENKKMQSIAARHDPKIYLHSGQVEASFEPPWATPISFACEITNDASAYVRHLFQELTAKHTLSRAQVWRGLAKFTWGRPQWAFQLHIPSDLTPNV